MGHEEAALAVKGRSQRVGGRQPGVLVVDDVVSMSKLNAEVKTCPVAGFQGTKG